MNRWKCLNDRYDLTAPNKYKVGFCNGCANKCNRCGCDGSRHYEIGNLSKDGELFISMPTHAIIIDTNKKSWKFHEYGS